MNVRDTIDNAFTVEWERLINSDPFWPVNFQVDKFYVLNQTLAVNDVQSFVDNKIRTSDNRALTERYHSRNLRVLAYQYADILFEMIESQPPGTGGIQESIYGKALKKLKGENLNCAIYPCIPGSSNLQTEIETYTVI